MSQDMPPEDDSQFPPPGTYQPPPYQAPGYLPPAFPPPGQPPGYPYGGYGEPPKKRKVWPWLVGAGVLVVLSLTISAVLTNAADDDWFEYGAEMDDPSSTGNYFGYGDLPFGAGANGIPLPVDSSLPPEEDIAEITSAFEVAFDPESTPEEWVAAVNAPEATGEQLRATTAGCDSAEVAVGKMYLLDSSNAAVEFRFAGSGIPVADDVLFIGTADLVEGKWKVSEYTIDKIIREAAPFC